MRFDQRPAGFDRSGDDLGQVYRRFLQADFALADARNFHKVVHQPDHLLDLSIHQLVGLRNHRRIVAAQCENLNGVAEGGERVAQLVGQRRQEVIFAAVSLPQRLCLAAERLFHLPAFGEIQCHPVTVQRLAIWAVYATATGGNPMEAAVRPDHPIFILVLLAILQCMLNALNDAFTVIGMYSFNQIFVGEMVVRRPTKVRLVGGGTSQLVCAEIQMTASQFGRFQSHLQPALALAQFLFCALALGDIYINADQTQRPSRLVEEDFPTRMDPVDAAVLPNYSPFGVNIIFAVYERAPHGLFGMWPVFGMHAFQPGLVAAVEAAGGQAVYRLGPVRPDDLIGLEIPLEAAEPGHLLSEVESLLIDAERFTRPLLLVNVRDQVDATHNSTAGVADRSAADTNPSFYPIAPVKKDLFAGHDFPLKRPRQHGFMPLDRSLVHFISEPLPIRFDVRRHNHRAAENLLNLQIGHDNPPAGRFGQYDAGRNVLDDGFQARPFGLKLRDQPLALRDQPLALRDQPLALLPCTLTFDDLLFHFNLSLFGVSRPGPDSLTSDTRRLDH